MKGYNQYIKDVQSGKVSVCKEVQNAVNRHVNDLKDLPKDRFKFSEQMADYYIGFIQGLKLSKGVGAAGFNIQLQNWQQFVIANIFGWYELRDGDWVRRFKKAYVEIPRKNGKTTLAAAIALCLFVADEEPGPEVYFAATKRAQANIGFTETKNMIRQNPHLSEYLEVFAYNIHYSTQRPGMIETLSSNSDKMSGLNIHGAIIDEVHEHKHRGIIDIVTTSISARTQPLIFEITTAPSNLDSICYEHHKMTSDILAGLIHDENWFGIIYGIDEGDDWEDPAVWLKANPNLGVPGAKKLSYMQSEFVEAKNSTSKSVAFKRLDLNILIFGAAGWIKDEEWTAAQGEIDWNEVIKLPCWGGLDLAQSKDFSSLALLFFDKENKIYYTKEYTWAPSENLKDMAARNNPSILQWVADGWIVETDGNIIDPDYMQAEIIKIIKSLPDFRSLAYDKMYAYQMMGNIEKEGIVCMEFSQRVTNFAAPTAGFEADLKAKKIIHDSNPCTRWMVSNCVIKNVNDMKKIVRNSTKYKIDTVIAMVMAYGQMLTDTAVPEPAKSVYETRGIITF